MYKKNKILRNLLIQSLPLLFLFISFSLTANPPVLQETNRQSGTLSKYVQKKYKKDAVRLALRLISSKDNFKALDIDLPNKTVNSIYQALVAIHESNLPEAELVTKSHKLHTFPAPTVDRFFLIYERKAEWSKPLRLGAMETESKKINALLEKYGLVIDRNSEWDEEHNSLHIRANEPLNISRLVEEFKKVNGVVKIDLLQPDGDGNDIEIKATDAGWMVNYILKFDSCIHGCKKRHFWSFEVNHEGQVIFLGEYGDDLPDWMQSNGPFAGK